ncbi:hypothetical protein GCM10017557_34340 [Streptomyces aurantiacus]|uniref:Uncharacterized protein n=1 Tax=Streptomyces aurantiacus TaxID=47760 RepID=A0A7G1P696_9ACTN|nr:hypothetical protein GCM10017557_34340 [Streptomyces aurantiacus]
MEEITPGRVRRGLRLARAHWGAFCLGAAISINEGAPRIPDTVSFGVLTEWHAAGKLGLQQLAMTITETEHPLWLGAPDDPARYMPGIHTPFGGAEHHAT